MHGDLDDSHPFKSSPVGNLNEIYWKDKSNNQNHAVSSNSPTLLAGSQNGLSVMQYDATEADFHEWNDISDIRTVFGVIERNNSNTTFGGVLQMMTNTIFLLIRECFSSHACTR